MAKWDRVLFGISILLFFISVSNFLVMNKRNSKITWSSGIVGSNRIDIPFVHLTRGEEEIPDWLRVYIEWHSQERSKLTQENWMDHRFLIARCIHGADPVCGGLTDRLAVLPFLLQYAAQSRRILLIQWTRPAPLQSWLQPNYIDWRLPPFIPVRGPQTKVYSKLGTLSISNSTVPVVCTRIQYSVPDNDPDWLAIIRPTFVTLFQAPRRRSASTFTAVAHVRARYGNHPVPSHKIAAVTELAVRCVRRRRDSTIVAVVSDAPSVLQHAATLPNVSTVGNDDKETTTTLVVPRHLDKEDRSTNVDDFASVFADLWLLAQSECVSYGPGGYGRLGAALSRNPQCSVAYFKDGRYQEC